MAAHESISYSCDNCGKDLHTFLNRLDIVTSKSEKSVGWRRLHVRILSIYGSHNDSNTEMADLCQACAKKLLKDALRRVTEGERATAGSEEIEQQGWND